MKLCLIIGVESKITKKQMYSHSLLLCSMALHCFLLFHWVIHSFPLVESVHAVLFILNRAASIQRL